MPSADTATEPWAHSTFLSDLKHQRYVVKNSAVGKQKFTELWGTPMYRTAIYLLGCQFTVLKTSDVAIGSG